MKQEGEPRTAASTTLKQCCARLYESDVAKLLLGESFHPGGLKLTERLGRLLELGPDTRVLDVASGRGTSAIYLAERFGCTVVGIDFGSQSVEHANEQAAIRGMGWSRIHFQQADAESLPFPDTSFDVVVCECAFCTFPDKSRVATEFSRVLRRGGRLGINDLTRSAALPKALEGLLSWISCIADAQPIESYIEWFRAAGLAPQTTESHDDELVEMVRQVQSKLLGIEIMNGLKKIDLPGLDLTSAKEMAQAALSAVQTGQLGYAVIIGAKPD
jgi:ubiquinone/menaquinone biosynthesis C-methylase UbiE